MEVSVAHGLRFILRGGGLGVFLHHVLLVVSWGLLHWSEDKETLILQHFWLDMAGVEQATEAKDPWAVGVRSPAL